MPNSPELHTLQHKLYTYLNASTNLKALMSSGGGGSVSGAAIQNILNAKTIKYTISMVTIIPILLVYPFMQRHFEKGIMLGAVKG
jgi:multiple sugar transport system permease protein/putative aldouronate transport system permease protein